MDTVRTKQENQQNYVDKNLVTFNVHIIFLEQSNKAKEME